MERAGYLGGLSLFDPSIFYCITLLICCTDLTAIVSPCKSSNPQSYALSKFNSKLDISCKLQLSAIYSNSN